MKRMNSDFSTNTLSFNFSQCQAKLALNFLRQTFSKIPRAMFDSSGDKCFCAQCFTDKERVFTRGKPPKKYCLPIGWTRFGLATNAGFLEMNNVWGAWHVSYHGTSAQNMVLIFKAGKRLLKAGDVALGGKEIGVVKG